MNKANLDMSAVKGLPNPPERLFYTMPYAHPTRYGARWIMRAINRPVVQRTWALFEIAKSRSSKNAALAYGKEFRYDEFVAMPGLFTAIAFTLGLGVLAVSLFIKPVFFFGTSVSKAKWTQVRWLFKKMIPQPGSATLSP
jgi:hypothetical protein